MAQCSDHRMALTSRLRRPVVGSLTLPHSREARPMSQTYHHRIRIVSPHERAHASSSPQGVSKRCPTGVGEILQSLSYVVTI